jgi:type VI secretion system protein ImpI
MSLLLTLEQGPRSQLVRQTRLDEGELVIGRSADAGWQIDDPDMFVSRAHCKISGGRDGYYVTDTSSSGLFIDDSDSPLGTGRSTQLQSGMRLRMGDYVLHVEVQPSAGHTSIGQAPVANNSARAWSPPQSRTPPSGDDFFSAQVEQEPQRPRPAGLPDPFEQPVPGAYDRASSQRSSPAFDDPFSLDPVATPASSDEPAAGRSDPFGFGDMPSRGDTPDPVSKPSGFDDFSFGPAATPTATSADTAGRNGRLAEKLKAAHRWETPAQVDAPPAPPPRSAPAPKPSRPTSPAPSDMALRAAFLRGMGVEEADFPGRDPIAEMEKFGREYRLMLDGLMQLLRKRAEEKGSARVAQTIVGASEVNPLKFLPTVEDVIVTIIA